MILGLYVLSAVLPIVGIARLFGVAKRDALQIGNAAPSKSGAAPSMGQVNVAMPIVVHSIRTRPSQVRADIWLIGAGVAFSALAGILSIV